MGLFSFFGKNKQGRAAEDSGRFYSKDDDAALGERARAKRASSAGATAGAGRRSGNDPLLPEKKRARRRLVGAIALALAAVVGLPMLLDSEPKPVAGDIAIQIPSKDKAPPLPVPSAPTAEAGAPVSGSAPATPAASVTPPPVKAVAAEDSVDKDEEILKTPPAPKVVAKAEPKPEPKSEAKPEPKAEHKPEHKPEPKPEHKDSKLADKADKPVKPKPDEKPAKPHDDARALAILEGKGADKADKGADKADKEKDKAEAGAQKFVLQVAALSSQEKAAELQAKLREAGISSYTQKGVTSAGELVRVKIGPLSKDEAEKVRAKLGRLGLSPSMTPV